MNGEGSAPPPAGASPRRAESDGTAGRRFTIFSFLFAAAALFHQARLEDFSSVFPDLAVSIAAIALLVRPSSTARFLVLLALEAAAVATDLPAVVNHSLFVALTAVGVFVAVGAGVLTRQPWLGDRGALFRRLAPVVRVEVVLLYLFAGLAKLNQSFFDPLLSCAPAMTEDLLTIGPLGLYASWQATPAIGGTLLVELGLPILLFFRRTRLVGVFVGVGFHTVLAVAGHVPFSGFAMAFYFLFVPDDVPQRLDQLRSRRPSWERASAVIGRFASSPAAFAALAGAWLAAAGAVSLGPPGALGAVHLAANALFLVYVAGLVVALGGALLQGGRLAYEPGAFRLAHPVWLVAPLLVVANGVSPYVGLKTQSVWTMYSNLQTEENRWNHLLVPEAVRVFGYQDHTVRVVASDLPALADAARQDRRLAWVAFREMASEHPAGTVVYERGDLRISAYPIATDPVLRTTPGAVETALLAFRDVPPSERNDCRSRRPYSPGQGS
jgi:hypothetical protein